MIRIVLSILLTLAVDVVTWFAIMTVVGMLLVDGYTFISTFVFAVFTLHGTKVISTPLSTILHNFFKLEEIK